MKKKIAYILGVAAVLFLVIWLFGRGKKENIENLVGLEGNVYEETYLTYLESHGYDGTFASSVVDIDISQYTTTEEMSVSLSDKGLETGDEGSITWNFTVNEEGFYNLKLGYLPSEGTSVDIIRKIYLDNEQIYDGLSQIVLKRNFTDEPIKTKNNNEIRPSAIEVFNKHAVYVEDYNRRNGEPYAFYLTRGSHSLTFEVIKEPIIYTSLSFEKEEIIPSYEEKLASLGDVKEYKGEYLLGQAERREGNTLSVIKSSTSINVQKNYSDSNVVPYHPYRILYNTIGAKSFSMPGDYITWELDVPEEGLYQLTFKGRQHENRGVTAFRKIKINNEVPFLEMKVVPFPYESSMTNYTLKDEVGNPYLYHLQAGKNTITMEVVLGEFGKVLTEVEKSMFELNQLYLKTIQITGQAPSQYIDYEIVRKVSGFVETMERESERLLRACDELVRITGEKGENTSLIEKMARQAQELAKDPERVIKELAQLKNNIAALGTWIVNISEMPLELDSVILSAAGDELPSPKDGFFEGLYYGTVRFFSTFFVK